MSYEIPYARVTTDNGPAAEVLHVSPIFVSCGPRTRGRFADRRLSRARRTEARHESRARCHAIAEVVCDESANVGFRGRFER